MTFVGNPAVGTPLLQASQTIGIDLPVRYLAWEDDAGAVRVDYPDIRTPAQRHVVTGVDEALTMIEKATAWFTATGGGRPGLSAAARPSLNLRDGQPVVRVRSGCGSAASARSHQSLSPKHMIGAPRGRDRDPATSERVSSTPSPSRSEKNSRS